MTLPLLIALLASLSALPSPILVAATSSSTSHPNPNPNPSPTIPVLFFGKKVPMAGSVIASDTSAVTLAVHCPASIAPAKCDLPSGGYTFTQGPSTVGTEYCKLDPVADAATCTATMITESSTIHSETALSGYKHMMYPVTITAGAEKLAASGDGGASAMLTTGTATATTTGTATVTSTRTNAAGASGDDYGGGGEACCFG
ncbi:uncharacterized protein CPUR_06040 [Claviceps purpurea 20.1]|uniref:Uncharacterized protein n=1 Tax=Claviceps purpurea (strain 20.1) TaxID=1111077 RepID=M1W8Z3_CLAP2|nr:uncharacterized protein CPUR_06040 [Claviceps purpurea 20.1]